jgi:hypothetical protein
LFKLSIPVLVIDMLRNGFFETVLNALCPLLGGEQVKTGKDVVRHGAYASNCCLAELELEKGRMFPRCPKCLKLTVWESTMMRPAASDKKAA